MLGPALTCILHIPNSMCDVSHVAYNFQGTWLFYGLFCVLFSFFYVWLTNKRLELCAEDFNGCKDTNQKFPQHFNRKQMRTLETNEDALDTSWIAG